MVNELILIVEFQIQKLLLETITSLKQMIKNIFQKLNFTPTKKYLNRKEVKKFLSIGETTLRKLMNNGDLPFSRITVKKRLFVIKDIEDYIARNEIKFKSIR